MKVIQTAEVSTEEFISQVTVHAGCEDGGHCKYCINMTNYSN